MLNEEHSRRMELHRARLHAEVLEPAELLFTRIPGVKAVRGFGSVFSPGVPISETSDIDLAIEGGNLIEAVKIGLRSRYRVDVVDITGQDDYFARSVRTHGVLRKGGAEREAGHSGGERHRFRLKAGRIVPPPGPSQWAAGPRTRRDVLISSFSEAPRRDCRCRCRLYPGHTV